MAPLGYAWWYLDAISDDGRHALVLIAFIGSVFSPAYYRARHRDGAASPYDHCAMNVALYGSGRGHWALTEYRRHALRLAPDSLTVGANTLAWDGKGLTCSLDERAAPLPSRLRGTVRLDGAAIAPLRLALTNDGVHHWRPIVPRARVSVDLEHPRLRWEGTGYLDCNDGGAPLDEAFRSWSWLRAHGRDGSAVIYQVSPARGAPTTHALGFDTGGNVHAFASPPQVRLPNTLWGMARSVPADAGGAARVLATLEDAPFYARSLVRTRLRGEPVVAMHESLSLRRFQSAWVRSLLPFRIRRSRR